MTVLVQNEYVWEVMDGFGGMADKQVHKVEDQVTRVVNKRVEMFCLMRSLPNLRVFYALQVFTAF